MTTPLLGPMEKRLAEMEEREAMHTRVMRAALLNLECDYAGRMRTATWLAASGWLTALVLAAALVL